MKQATPAAPPEGEKMLAGIQYEPPIVIGIAGPSDSGKTQLMAGLIQELKFMAEDVRIAAIKHCPHGHQADREGSDTDRMRIAGAITVVASSMDAVTTFATVDGETAIETLIASLSPNHDVILVEGYKSSLLPKLLLSSDADGFDGISNVVATVGDIGSNEFAVPDFKNTDTGPLAEWIVANPVLRQRSPSVSLRIDGEAVDLKRFPSQALSGVVKGFVSSLSGISDDYRRIEISVTSNGQGS